MGHCAIRRGWDKVNVIGERVLGSFKDFNHFLADFGKVATVNLDLDGGGLLLFVAFAIWDVVRNKVDFDCRVNVFPSSLDDFVHDVMAVDRGRHHADKASRCNIVGACKTVRTHEVAALFEPLVESSVAFQFSEGLWGADADKEANYLAGFVRAAGGILEASNILGDGIASWDVTLQGEGAVRGFLIDWKEEAGGSDVLQFT